MPPSPNVDGTPETEHEVQTEDYSKKEGIPKAAPRIYDIQYIYIMSFSYLHIAGLYGVYLCFTSAKLATIGFGILMYIAGVFGVTAGAHRLWSHRSFKAKMPLQILLMLFNCISFQNTAITWVRDHRLHHKCCDTDADPHNASRGFFYSHIGWLITKKSDMVIKHGRALDMTDIYNNPVLRFQKKYAVPLMGTLCFVLPTLIPWYFWGESLNNTWHLNILRYVAVLNVSWSVNSFAHKWGYRPYDKNIMPSENYFVNLGLLGEGFHNYHHAFPFDYRTSELGHKWLNLTLMFIDFCAWIGWAYDLKTTPKHIVESRSKRTGDGTDMFGNPIVY